MRQDGVKLSTHLALVQKRAPKGHPPIRREPLVREADPNRLCPFARANFDHRLVSAACVWLSCIFHSKHSFNPQRRQTPSESFRLREKGLLCRVRRPFITQSLNPALGYFTFGSTELALLRHRRNLRTQSCRLR